MIVRTAGLLGAAAAVMLVGAAGLFFFFSTPARGVAFAEVLAKSEKADTLHVRFTRGNEEVEFWHTSSPNRSRWDDLAGKYRIADGAKYWIVNEHANQARRANPPARTDQPLHRFLEDLGLGKHFYESDLKIAWPVARQRDGERDVLIYNGIGFEAIVDAATHRLHWLRTPRGELTVVAYDDPIAAAKFVVADTLTEDGRIGKVTDVQGLVTVKPVLHQRWTPIRPHLVLRPGDWVRTDARGANAIALRLVKQTNVVLGPKSLVELVGPTQVRLIEGEMEIAPEKGAAVDVIGPGGQKTAVKGKQLFRVQGKQIVRLDTEPPWLLGFRGVTTNNVLGSLVALVDGRNVPLSVGYHKVTVDIRDQIARTVIEESFVNHTNTQLEGVFNFPLPPDASISGFGMWIGDQLVEADVVEKQRAREIFETFLRERRDPALLEWSGGNMFKARVFPIFGNSEKRIKITYTQVLPQKGNRYHYSYALVSELLKQHPLRELSIDVKVNSAVPLKSATSPTHETRDERTDHSAHVEFTAQEYTPTRDFEVVVETAERQADAVLIPHRRGDDGYFMLQITPPHPNPPPQGGREFGHGDRSLLPDGEPVELLILADTSASIDASQRATQATFIGALLAALTPKDRFNLAVCDVTCDWAFPQAVPADSQSYGTARELLAQRTPLGWTNLDVAFASALKQAGPRTHIVYVGDGIVTTGDADPVAFTKRLRRLYEGNTATMHAVSLGSSYEAGVLRTIASLGGGSLRKVTSEQGPLAVAPELLGEIAQPGLRDIKVEFRGMKVARVYPEALANVPSGTQQILLGRYLPEGKDQTGEVIVTATQGGKPVRFSTRVSLKDAEQGNSFIPRLWARMHLDTLLDQGTAEPVRDEIIALSEEYKIITPYTSFLVLETDADRERFKVTRRFQMRDGERFFAEGRDNAVLDLAQKQMKRAGQWRTALRRSVLRELARLGRDPRIFQPASPYLDVYGERAPRDRILPMSGMYGNYFTNGAGVAGAVPLGDLAEPAELNERLGRKAGDVDAQQQAQEYDLRELDAAPEESKKEALAVADGRRFEPGRPAGPAAFAPLGGEFGFLEQDDLTEAVLDDAMDFKRAGGRLRGSMLRGALDEAEALSEWAGRVVRGPQARRWLDTLFPPLRGTSGVSEPKSTWPAPARALAKSLLRRDQLGRLTGGIEIARTIDSFDARWGDLTGRARRADLVAAKAWLTRSASDGGQTLISWCDGKEVGIFSKATQLGRIRAAAPLDVQPPPLELEDHSLTSLEETYAAYRAAVESSSEKRAVLVLKPPSQPDDVVRVTIDTARHVIVRIEHRHKDRVTSATTFGDFVEVAGCWWAQKIETTDADGKRVSLTTQTVTPRTAKQLDERVAAELSDRPQVQFVHLPLPELVAAKKALTAGTARFEDQFRLLLHFHRSQQWPRVLDHLQQAEKVAAGKPGLRWLRSALLHDSRRHEELRKRYQDDAARLARQSSGDAFFLAEHLMQDASGVLQTNEMMALCDVLRPLYDQQPAQVHAAKRWQQWRVVHLGQAGRTDESVKLQKQLATEYPRDYAMQQQYAHALANIGDHPAAYAWLTRALAEGKWRDDEAEALRSSYTRLLEQEGRYADLVKYLAAWVGENPDGGSAYAYYLSALVKADQADKADALALRWLKEAQAPAALAPAVEGRLSAAMNYLLGNGYQLYTNRIEERWLTPLAEAALALAHDETRGGAAGQILGNYQFQRSDEARAVRKALAATLAGEVARLPVAQLQRRVGWVGAEDLEPAAWSKVVSVLRQRWTKEGDDAAKHLLGQTLASLLPAHGGAEAALAFLRLQREAGPAIYRVEYTNHLFNYLLEQPWTDAVEAEAFTLLDKLSNADDAGERLFATVAALHRLTDRLVEACYAARMKLLDHPEKLTRTELMKKEQENRRLAREGLADRLRKEAAKHPKTLSRWLLAESMYLDVLLDRNLQEAAALAWEIAGPTPPAKLDDTSIAAGLDRLLQRRAVVTLMNLATRKSADAALVDRLLKYLDDGIRAEVDSGTWKRGKYELLVALDRPKELERTLTAWVREDDADSRWRTALGYLLAEQGRVAEAIRQFETVEAADELTPAHYRALADWYLVMNRRDDHERAAQAVYKTTPENYLHALLANRLQPWQRHDGGRLPTELDREVLRIFAVLFAKSAAPQNYLYLVQQFYGACHDFRLLGGLADAVVGHSAGRVYPFLQAMTPVLTEVRDEATADELVKRIAATRTRAATPVDHRALDLLEVLVERRAAELLNQPGPHRDRALAALVRAGKREWSPGEPRLMADFLGGLGVITQAPLAKEQLRLLQELHQAGKSGTQDRLHIAYRYALTLAGYQRRAEAIDLLQTALNEFRDANDGVLPVSANEALAAFVAQLEAGGHFARGERVLLAELEHPIHAQQRRWQIQRLDELYLHALQRGGEVALGKNLALYQALDLKLKKDILDNDPNQRQHLVVLLCQVYRTAHEQKREGVLIDVKRFAFEILPPLLPQLANNYPSVVSTVAVTVHDLAGPRDGIVFLVNQIETEPRWLRYGNQDSWNQHGWTIATWRLAAKDLGDAGPRLLRLALAELRRDLIAREDRQRPLYNSHYSGDRFWAEKADDFARVAEEVLAERSQSTSAVQHIAHYFYWGLGRHKRAIDILLVAHQQKILDEVGQAKLVEFLHYQNRFTESIPVLLPLVERRRDNLEYRVQLMHAYFRTGQKEKLLALLKDTDAFFHKDGRWSESVLTRLAQSTLSNELYEQCVAYSQELIPLHERTQPHRGIGNGVLSAYYSNLASAYAGLQKTPEAVEAAGAAVVAWGPNYNQRAAALERLRQVLLQSPDLDGFVKYWDKQKQDSAIVRKALGQAYRAKGEHAKAIVQFELAAELQPNDADIQQLLIGALDARGDKEGIVRRLLQAVQVSRRDLKLYEELGKRYAAAGQDAEAERAFTSIVEVQPAEAESHALLAEVRERQSRWTEAIEQWEQVARLRALEPTGLVKLAGAQISAKQWGPARETLRKLSSRSWPPRFNDISQQIRVLESRIPN